ncbi:hypothetical protein C7448_103146 [Tenacibaculum gallaicum]|uniref:DUF3592 domain-containing protein n=1 Tax=Tenacibaculum gallaicum TaxID=561505 RepID=A0A3E0I112_9FLAO|nr:hypothetical protein [Tenacibaculum gallaicum]REH52414.1 hypothetical protein C7448_103146 [Tenacibaculum gallaicum]
MNSLRAFGFLLYFIIFFGGLYFLWNSGNIAFFLGKTTKVNAKIDSIKVVYGTAGRGYHQKIYYQYKFRNKTYSSNFRNKATMWEPIQKSDSLQLKISNNNPQNNKVIGVYFSY